MQNIERSLLKHFTYVVSTSLVLLPYTGLGPCRALKSNEACALGGGAVYALLKQTVNKQKVDNVIV